MVPHFYPQGGSLVKGEIAGDIRWQLKAQSCHYLPEECGSPLFTLGHVFGEKNRGLSTGELGLNPCSAVYMLCGLRQVK